MHRWAAAAAIAGGLAWIPIRLAIGVTFSEPLLGLTYVQWNQLEVIPLALMLVALVAGVGAVVASRLSTIGLWIAAIGLAGMLVGVVVEFWIAGGLSGDRELSTAGWGVYLLAMAVHVVGMVPLGIGLLRAGGRRRWRLGALAIAVGVLHALWLPSGLAVPVLGLVDQALIGLAWAGIGLALLASDAAPGAAGPRRSPCRAAR